MELISVLIPVYNVEKFVKQAVESIMNQTYRNLEIIIVDDCSTDKTVNILTKLAAKDKRIKLLRNSKKRNICYSLNKALKYSTGKYIARMDGDDISDLNRIEKQYKFLKNNPNIKLVGNSIMGIDKDGNVINHNIYLSGYKDLKIVSLFKSPVSHIWLAYKEVYDSLNGYRNIPYAEDYDFLLRMISYGYKFDNISNYFGYKVRTRMGNTSSTAGLKQLKSFNYVRSLYFERNKNKSIYDAFSNKKRLKYIKTNNLEEKFYNKSVVILQKAIKFKSNSNKLWIVYTLLACFLSPYQLVYLIRACIYRIYCGYKFKLKDRG